jgi:hypothetical protein
MEPWLWTVELDVLAINSAAVVKRSSFNYVIPIFESRWKEAQNFKSFDHTTFYVAFLNSALCSDIYVCDIPVFVKALYPRSYA